MPLPTQTVRNSVKEITADQGLGELHAEMFSGRMEGQAGSRRNPHPAHLRLAAMVQRAYRYHPWRPRHICLVFQDLAGRPKRPAHDDKTHLAAALEWLCLAQEVCEGRSDAGGVSAGWSFEDGWLPGYPETTG